MRADLISCSKSYLLRFCKTPWITPLLKKISARKLFIAGFVLLAGAFLLYAICVVDKENHGVLKVISERVDLQIKDFHYTEVDKSGLVWEVNADTARYFREDDITRFENVAVKLVLSNGGIYTMTGERGSLHTDTGNIDICGNVVAVSNSKERFETDALHYSHNDGRIHTEDFVKMIRPGTAVKGTGMTISLKDRKITLLSGVSAIIKKE